MTSALQASSDLGLAVVSKRQFLATAARFVAAGNVASGPLVRTICNHAVDVEDR